MKSTRQKMQANQLQLQQPCGCGGAMRGTLPNEAQPGLHLKPMYATIGRVLALHRRGGRNGQRIRSKTQNTNKKLFLAS